MAFRPEHEIYKRRLGRNLGVGLLLALFVALVFGLTVVKVMAIGERGGFNGIVRQETAPEGAAP